VLVPHRVPINFKENTRLWKIQLNSILSCIPYTGHSADVQSTHRRLRPSLPLKDFTVLQSGKIYGFWPMAEA